ncbi:ricin-type beta-trefoil lectin domain protein [Pelomyxa schiedti]|nr:ricin-type beta-trefoil lectin domain protein [Pelomyxa schiedti]
MSDSCSCCHHQDATHPLGHKRWTLQLLRGLSTNRTLLSCTGAGDRCDLWHMEDGSGRQIWETVPIDGAPNMYYIMISGGTEGNRRYLSCNAEGTRVDCFNVDDNTGRQKWLITPVPESVCTLPCVYYIRVSAGITNTRALLSSPDNGTFIDLWFGDDNTGRQRWQFQKHI